MNSEVSWRRYFLQRLSKRQWLQETSTKWNKMDKPESEQMKHKTYMLELPNPDGYMQRGRNSPVKVFLSFYKFSNFQKMKTPKKASSSSLQMTLWLKKSKTQLLKWPIMISNLTSLIECQWCTIRTGRSTILISFQYSTQILRTPMKSRIIQFWILSVLKTRNMTLSSRIVSYCFLVLRINIFIKQKLRNKCTS